LLQPRPKVLVADDDHNLRQLLMEALPKHKFEVYQAADGNETWDTVKNLRPDIVLLDIMMPGLDGHEICKLMRENPQTRNIPVIMLTARAQLKDKLEGIEAGADDYITKPFDPMELQARIEMHLRRYLRDSDMSPITELPGNKAIESALVERIESGRKFAFLYIDLDDFKAFNDYYGFTAGSDVIRMTGGVLAEALEENGSGDDFLGHVGGDGVRPDVHRDGGGRLEGDHQRFRRAHPHPLQPRGPNQGLHRLDRPPRVRHEVPGDDHLDLHRPQR